MDTLRQSVIKKDQSLTQTHTQFDGQHVLKLHLTETRVQKVRDALFKLSLLPKFDTDEFDGPKWNALSEKVPPGGLFRMFLDLDWKTDQVKGNANLVNDIQEIVKSFSDVMNELVGNPVEFLIATRLTYKIHLYFPDVIVNRETALQILQILENTLKKVKPNMYFDKVMDQSVYSTGLRMIWCHKGKFGIKVKDREREDHIKAFGNTYKSCYHLVDPESLLPLKRKPEHLQMTSILTTEQKLTELPGLAKLKVNCAAPKKRGRPPKHVQVSKVEATKSTENSANLDSNTAQRDDFPSLIPWIESTFDIDLNCSIKVFKSSNTITFGTKGTQVCPFVERSHKGNNVYIRLDNKSGCRKMCHDPDCKDKEFMVVSFDDLPTDAQNDFYKNLGVIMYNEHQKLEMFEKHVQDSCKKDHPNNNFDVNYEKSMIHSKGLKAKLLDLFCVKCNKQHEDPQAYLICNLDGLVNFECIRQFDGAPISLTTLPPTITNNVFQGIINIYNTVNHTVNNYACEQQSLQNFGSYEEFPRTLDDDKLNKLLWQSLSKGSVGVTQFAFELMKSKFMYVNKQWYYYNGSFWEVTDSEHEIYFINNIIPIYARLHELFDEEKRAQICTILKIMYDANKRTAYMKDLQLQARKKCEFDTNAHLIPFQNGVLDSRCCEFRAHSPDDMITRVIDYDLPDKSDPLIRAQIHAFFESILPDEEVRLFLLTYLALHLEGNNRHQILVILTGTGGNGKGMLKYLMDITFKHLHTETSPTFLTGERPADDKATANLVDLRNKRSVWASEPEHNKQINGGFLKTIAGGDKIKCRPLHSNDFIEYIPRFLVTLLCNTIPQIGGIQDDVQAIKRRLLIVNFPIQFVKVKAGTKLGKNEKPADLTLGGRMKTWGPEMMLYLIEMYKSYLDNDYQLNIPQVVRDNVDDELAEANLLEPFFEECLTYAEGTCVHIHRLVDSYRDFLQRKGRYDRVTSNIMRTMLTNARCYEVKEKERDSTCTCKNPTRTLMNYCLL